MTNLYEQECQKFKKAIQDVAEQAFDELVADRLPWLEHDTIMNVEQRTRDVMRALLSGDFDVDGEYLIAKPRSDSEFSVRIAATDNEWDNFRESLIKLMPQCPKDQRIKMLEDKIRRMEDAAW